MFKQLLASILLLVFAVQTFNKAVIVFDYFANTTTYAQNCENKAKPQMHCVGKCQMMMKLRQEEKRDQQNPERKAENKNEIALSSKSFYPALILPAREHETYFLMVASSKATKMPRSLLRPPVA